MLLEKLERGQNQCDVIPGVEDAASSCCAGCWRVAVRDNRITIWAESCFTSLLECFID